MNSPTLSNHATQAGIILGTAAYMSPEQAAGKPVDKRSDLWAFGVVLIEMLTGRRVFDGETVSHVIAAVLTRDPDWTSLPASTPAPIRRLLRRCLERDRKRRLDSAGAARFEIDDALTAPLATDGPSVPLGAAPAYRRRAWAVAATLILASGVAVWQVAVRVATLPPAIRRLAVSLPASQAAGSGPGRAWRPAGSSAQSEESGRRSRERSQRRTSAEKRSSLGPSRPGRPMTADPIDSRQSTLRQSAIGSRQSQMTAGRFANRPYTFFRKYSSVFVSPSSRPTLGSHPSSVRARVMSGWRTFGSSSGSGR